MSDVSIDPTHTVVYGDLTAHPNRERSVTAEAIATAARRADRLCVLLDDEAVEEAFEGVGAGVLPKRSLCRWEVEGTTYELAPPNLCVDRTCFGLSPLRDVAPDRDDLTIRLRWADSSPASRLIGLLGGVLDRIAPPRPRELAFEDEAQFETATDEFERVLGAIRS